MPAPEVVVGTSSTLYYSQRNTVDFRSKKRLDVDRYRLQKDNTRPCGRQSNGACREILLNCHRMHFFSTPTHAILGGGRNKRAQRNPEQPERSNVATMASPIQLNEYLVDW